jgi:cell division septum initiation protein DivIVA
LIRNSNTQVFYETASINNRLESIKKDYSLLKYENEKLKETCEKFDAELKKKAIMRVSSSIYNIKKVT